MKICKACLAEHMQPRSDFCIKCQRKAAMKRYAEKNREKLTEYARKYRQEFRELVGQRSKRSREEKIEYYRQKQLERFIKKNNLPVDYKPWKKKAGQGNITQAGYKVITLPDSEKGHPNAFDARRRIHEHTYIMSKHIGRALFKGETVHHINGDRLDNRIENLELWHRSHPPGQRLEDKIAWCKEFLKQYGYKVILSERDALAGHLFSPPKP